MQVQTREIRSRHVKKWEQGVGAKGSGKCQDSGTIKSVMWLAAQEQRERLAEEARDEDLTL